MYLDFTASRPQREISLSHTKQLPISPPSRSRQKRASARKFCPALFLRVTCVLYCSTEHIFLICSLRALHVFLECAVKSSSFIRLKCVAESRVGISVYLTASGVTPSLHRCSLHVPQRCSYRYGFVYVSWEGTIICHGAPRTSRPILETKDRHSSNFGKPSNLIPSRSYNNRSHQGPPLLL